MKLVMLYDIFDMVDWMVEGNEKEWLAFLKYYFIFQLWIFALPGMFWSSPFYHYYSWRVETVRNSDVSLKYFNRWSGTDMLNSSASRYKYDYLNFIHESLALVETESGVFAGLSKNRLEYLMEWWLQEFAEPESMSLFWESLDYIAFKIMGPFYKWFSFFWKWGILLVICPLTSLGLRLMSFSGNLIILALWLSLNLILVEIKLWLLLICYCISAMKQIIKNYIISFNFFFLNICKFCTFFKNFLKSGTPFSLYIFSGWYICYCLNSMFSMSYLYTVYELVCEIFLLIFEFVFLLFWFLVDIMPCMMYEWFWEVLSVFWFHFKKAFVRFVHILFFPITVILLKANKKYMAFEMEWMIFKFRYEYSYLGDWLPLAALYVFLDVVVRYFSPDFGTCFDVFWSFLEELAYLPYNRPVKQKHTTNTSWFESSYPSSNELDTVVLLTSDYYSYQGL